MLNTEVRLTAFPPDIAADRPLAAYLLGCVGLPACLAFQRRLAYEIGDGRPPAVVVCEHPAGVTVGRAGSDRHIHLTQDELAAREWPVSWVARGGGVMVHAAGQACVYPVLPLAELNLTPAAYVAGLAAAVAAALVGLGVAAEVDAATPGVRIGRRRVAHVGAAVRGGVTQFGAVVNVNPDLELFRGVACDGDPMMMTSVQRESSTPVRGGAVRQAMVDAVAKQFGFTRVSVFHTHPALAAASGIPHAHPARC